MSQIKDQQDILTADDLISGSKIIYDVEIPGEILNPGSGDKIINGRVRIRPLTISTLNTISKAAREDPGLIPILMINQSIIEPELNVNQVRQMHVGLVHFLVNKINQVSGLSRNGYAVNSSFDSTFTKAHVLLAKHFGWTPRQVSQLTPGQVAIYLAGIEKLLEMDKRSKDK